MNKKTITISIITLVIAVIVGGFWYTKNQKNTIKPIDVVKDVQEEIIKDGIIKEVGIQEGQKNENIEELNVEDIDTSNWKIYRNEEFGFEVKYPDGWEITPGSESENEKVWSIGFREKDKYYPYEGSLEDIAIRIGVQRGDETYLNNSRRHALNVLRDRGATIKMINIGDSKGYYFSGFGEGYEVYRQIYTISISSSIIEDVKKELTGMFGTLKFIK